MTEPAKKQPAIVALVRWRRLIVVNAVIVAVLAAIVSLFLPQWFRARASLLPSMDQPVTPGVMRVLQDIGGPGAQVGAGGMNPGYYVEIIRSHHLGGILVDRFELEEAYGARNHELAVRALRKHTKVILTRNGIIEIYVEDPDRERAAELANAYVQELDLFNQESRSFKARRTRIFIDERVTETVDSIHVAEADLRDFQRENRAVEITEQTQATILAAAETMSRIYELKLQKSLLETFERSSHPEIRTLVAQIAELESQLDEYDRGALAPDTETGGERRSGVLPAIGDIPALASRFAELFERVESWKAIHRLLLSRLEDARIEEVRDTPTLETLDDAFPPTYRTRPQRKVIVAVSFLTALLLGALAAILMESARDERGRGNDDVTYVLDELTGDWERLRSFFRGNAGRR